MNKNEIGQSMFTQWDEIDSKPTRSKNPDRETVSEKCANNPDHLLKKGEFFCRHCGSNNENFVTTLGLYDGVCNRLGRAEINMRKSLKLLDSSVYEKQKVKRAESVQYWTDMKNDLVKEKDALAEELVKMQND